MPFFRKNKSPLPSGHSSEQLDSLQFSDSSQHSVSTYDDPYCHPAHVPSRHVDSPAPPTDGDKSRRNIFGRSSKTGLGLLERSRSVRHASGEKSPSHARHGEINKPTQAQSPIQRSNTESSLSNVAVNPPRFGQRPPSQQSPRSSFPYLGTMAERRKDGVPREDLGRESPARDTSSRESQREVQRESSRESRSQKDNAPESTKQEEEVDVRSLVQKHDELQTKYARVKRYYFEKEAQVQHLQNTVAHQRMAVSRTVLDDNEYSSRFNRLDGAIKDLAFSIRKDWKNLPASLQGYVNDDAHMVGMKEMTAIGRAVISRWLVEEVFHRYFHPGLEPSLSMQLKGIEMNLRQQQVRTVTEEDKENAIAKISNWRLATLDGLGDTLQGKAADENRTQLTDHLISKLVAGLETNLADPPPAGLDGSARTIIENTIGIAEKIPLESRDVCIEYFEPGTALNEAVMKIETGVPPLTNVKDTQPEKTDDAGDSSDSAEETPAKEKKTSRFSSWMKKSPGRNTAKKEEEPAKIRFASFISAEVRGRGPTNVLIKAPVYVE